MSRVSLAAAAFVTALVSFLPLPAQTALPIHGHPQKTSYASSTEWPFVSAQTHWIPAQNPVSGSQMPGHTHVQCWAPLYAEQPAAPFTIQCELQMFHVAGRVTALMGETFPTLTPESPLPLIGDPNGLVKRLFTATFSPFSMPAKGWWAGDIIARTEFDNGARADTQLMLPFYIVGDPAADEVYSPITLSSRVINIIPNVTTPSLPDVGNPTSEYIDTFVPIAPVTRRLALRSLGRTYAISDAFPGLGTWKQVNDPDLHNGVPGTTVGVVSNTTPGQVVQADAVYDPTIGPGAHKLAVTWESQTNASVTPHLSITALLVVSYSVPNVLPPPLQPSPNGTYGPRVVDNLGREFTMSGTYAFIDGVTAANLWDAPEGYGRGTRFCTANGQAYLQGRDGTWFYASATHWHRQYTDDPCSSAPPGPIPVHCAGTFGPWLEVNPSLWRREFTVTQQPMNGGKACAVVVNGG